MRAAVTLIALAVSVCLAEFFAGTAIADAPTLDVHTSSKSAVADYQLTPTRTLQVVAA